MNPLFLFVLLCFWARCCCQGNTSIDVDCLLEFKKGIRKDPLGRVMNTWVRDALHSDGCPQNWNGIECSGGLVTAITLTGLGLVGDLKFFTLYGLKNLRELDLSNNFLTGRLVPVIGMMHSLQRLDLSNNMFYGPIPGRIWALSGLTHLNLSVNNFSGSIPVGAETLHQLRIVDLHSNHLSGDVVSLLCGLRSPEHVDLSSNTFSGNLVLDASNCSSLVNSIRHLNLSHNVLTREFFTEDAAKVFTNLEVLDVGDNQLTGNVPSFESVSSLRVLGLRNNRFYGPVPVNLLNGGSNGLIELDLSGNTLSGSISTISSPSLKIMNLSSNSISGTLPSEIRSCTVLDLSKNMISGNLSALLTWSNTIELIDLSSNSLSGIFPNETSTFPNLTIIKLTNNSLAGILPPLLGRFLKLTVVDLSLNQFSGPIFGDLFTLPSLKWLHLSGNKFTGSIPLQRSHISLSAALNLAPQSKLENLDLSNNLLDGSLPPEIGNLSALTFLNLGKNYLSGEIPTEIRKLNSLEHLDLSFNNFSGSIPNVLLPNLTELNISYNNLSGNLPDCLRKFPHSSFYPGNSLLSITDPPAKRDHSQGLISSKDESRHLASGREVAIVLGSIVGAIVIAVLLVAVHYRAQVPWLGFRNVRSLGILSSLSKGGYTHPSSFRFTQSMDQVVAQSNCPTPDCPPPATVTESQQKEVISDTQPRSPAHTKELLPESEKVSDRFPNNGGSSQGAHLSSPALHTDAITNDQPVMLYAYSPDRLSGDLFFLDNSLIFTADELSRAPAEILGRSSHGTSYKATLDGGHVLTVKWLREGLVKRKKDFAKEAKRIGSIRHPNIVPLRGYYWGPKEHEKLIISDYINAESLADHLYGISPRRHPPLSFNQRLNIAVDVGKCLCYLHYEKGLPHGNLKTTNILLEHPDLTVRLTDYSLQRLMTASSTAEHILNLGALGYRAPELAASSSKPCPTLKADVYSFGVIVMELLTGKSAGEIISGNSGAVDLTDWVQLCANQGRIIECYDPDIVGNILVIEGYPKEIDEALAVSLRCILPVNERPDMKTILEQLCSIEAV